MHKLTFFGILGGTFDPIHMGHIHMATLLLEHLKLQQIRFLPCYQPVHRNKPLASPQDRVNMIKIAISYNPQFTLDLREIQRGSPSYMIDTLKSFREEFPTTSLCLILGEDAFSSLDTWRSWQELITLAHFLVISRKDGVFTPSPEVQKLMALHETKNNHDLTSKTAGYIFKVATAPIPISATDIRERLQTKLSTAKLLPEGVFDYIQKHHLYQDPIYGNSSSK